ncbi:TetR/AcrR family transcriptional regulator [Vibrio algarum]|uniref:TetR/AcrR family transcriptional regulator n=1 Tax=Vibrio algarum TaxID=3020714 RepID=A0ABT4YWX0_9VIBR|nr:TetR/AcrR family transcriptional regulator [Vibrio sp. KJ40-1]MDB1126080.1 TetR/AcrR family transcriptional regulator [Vibrio sp. KJ40-1]
MNDRKQGRRCAQTAEETKQLILMTAGRMFCEQGYEKVSLRNISEAAGVSHSLIRHHFGSKETIWYTVSDILSSYMQTYIRGLIGEFPEDKPANIILYHFTMKLMAHMLVNPQPLQFIADAIRQEGKFFDYFMDTSGDFEQIIQDSVEQHNKQNPGHQVDLWEIKWQVIYNSHAAISLKPLLNIVWEKENCSGDDALLKHWKLFNKKMINDLNIKPQDYIEPSNLKDLLLPIACDFSNPESCRDELHKFS